MEILDCLINATTKWEYKNINIIKICVLASAAHIPECQQLEVPFIDVDGLKAFNKDKNKIKKWAKKYDILLASDSVAKQVTKLLGNVLVKMGKFPIAMTEG